jgi:hypothetical protein
LSLLLLARSLAPLLAPLLALESMLRTYASLNSTEPMIWHCSPALKGMLGTYSSLKQRLNQSFWHCSPALKGMLCTYALKSVEPCILALLAYVPNRLSQ